MAIWPWTNAAGPICRRCRSGDLMNWRISHRADPEACELADRHYNRQSVGSDQFVPPGRCVVLFCETPTGKAFWITSYPYAEWVKHVWAGAWVCSAFRNEGAALASELILQAVAATRAVIGEPPPLGMVTFVRPDMVRRKRDPGRCFLRAGFLPCGKTVKGYLAFRLDPMAMPAAALPRGLLV